jgi:glycerol kinase
MTKHVGAIDQGTSSTRFIVFDAAGRIVSTAQKEHRQIFPQPGWVEHDPVEIWRNTNDVVATALDAAGLKPADLAAVGITNQRETTLLWDRDSGRPLHNAIVWQDTRVAGLVERYSREGGPDRFRARTGLPLSSYFSALKLRWLLDNVAEARTAAAAGHAAFGTIDSWLVWNLTGGARGGLHRCDVTNASRTQLMNLDTLDWDDSLLEAFGIARSVLPDIVPSSAVYGHIDSGPLRGVPIAGILGDQQAALVGQTCFAPGEVKNTYGTGCFLLMNTGNEPVASNAGLITTVAYRFGAAPAAYALEGSIAVTGALVQWLRDNLALIGSSDEIEGLAREAPDNGGVYFVPAFSGLYAPRWRADARGVITGLTGFANRAHIARAALEATAYQTREVVDAMERDTGLRIDELRVDGGMTANRLLMQFQADILNVPVLKARIAETTALGAAYAAGLAVGVWSGPEELARNRVPGERIEPGMSDADRSRLYREWQKAVQRSLDWA